MMQTPSKFNWKNYFQVHVYMTSGPIRKTMFANPWDAKEYAMEKVSHDSRTVSRIELRDSFGDEVVATVFDAGWR